jgi:hypothetical protein
MYLQKVISRKTFGILKVNDENSRIRIRIRIHLSEAWIRGSRSTPKCHGSATLLDIYEPLPMQYGRCCLNVVQVPNAQVLTQFGIN